LDAHVTLDFFGGLGVSELGDLARTLSRSYNGGETADVGAHFGLDVRKNILLSLERGHRCRAHVALPNAVGGLVHECFALENWIQPIVNRSVARAESGPLRRRIRSVGRLPVHDGRTLRLAGLIHGDALVAVSEIFRVVVEIGFHCTGPHISFPLHKLSSLLSAHKLHRVIH